MAKPKPSRSLSSTAYVNAGVAKFSPAIRATAKSALALLRGLTPGATEFVYDNYNAFVVGFGPNDRPSDAVFSIVIYPRQVNLGFIQGALLDDPDGILQGTGSQFRHVRLIPDASVLDRPEVRAMIAKAIAAADVPFDPRRKRTISVRAISKRQRSRRPRSESPRTARR